MRRLVLLFVTLTVMTGSRLDAWTLVGPGLGGWESRLLAISVNPDGCGILPERLERALDRAIEVWNSAPDGGVRLTRAREPVGVTVEAFLDLKATSSPVVLCDGQFALHNGLDANLVPASTRVSATGSRLDYAGILLNAERGKRAAIETLDESQLEVTLAHELGHVLGLGHGDDESSLMYFSLFEKKRAALGEDDRAGLAFLYPKNEMTAGPLGCAKKESASRVALGKSDDADALWNLIVWLGLALFALANVLAGRWWQSRRLQT